LSFPSSIGESILPIAALRVTRPIATRRVNRFGSGGFLRFITIASSSSLQRLADVAERIHKPAVSDVISRPKDGVCAPHLFN
jgi:hypothetical protein